MSVKAYHLLIPLMVHKKCKEKCINNDVAAHLQFTFLKKNTERETGCDLI